MLLLHVAVPEVLLCDHYHLDICLPQAEQECTSHVLWPETELTVSLPFFLKCLLARGVRPHYLFLMRGVYKSLCASLVLHHFSQALWFYLPMALEYAKTLRIQPIHRGL